MEEILHIAYSSDKRYLPYLAVALGSAFLMASDPRRIIVDVLALDIPEEECNEWIAQVLKRLPRGARVKTHHLGSEVFAGMREWHGSRAAYSRLLLPEILSDVKWCAYADVDTLFTDDPLKLIDLEDDRFAVLGHQEFPFKPLNDTEAWFTKRGLPFNKERYFCSGFILMNLERFRRDNVGEKTKSFLLENPNAPLVDQDALNAVCADCSGLLPYGWGIFGCEAFMGGRPGAIHYPGHNPWLFLDNMFPDYIDAYNLWFLVAKKLYGKTWSDYVANARITKYLRMRFLGCVFSMARAIQDAVGFVNLPFLSRYLRRHYAPRAMWHELLSDIERYSREQE